MDVYGRRWIWRTLIKIKIMNYDQWKLSNPVDDGYGYDMVSNCCGKRVDEKII